MNFTDSDHNDTHTVSATLKSKTLSSGSVIPATTLAHLNTAMSSSILTDSNGSGKLKWAFSAEDDDFDFLVEEPDADADLRGQAEGQSRRIDHEDW